MKKLGLIGIMALAGCGSATSYEQPQAKRIYFDDNGMPLSHGPVVESDTPFERITTTAGETIAHLESVIAKQKKQIAEQKTTQEQSLLGKNPYDMMSGKKPEEQAKNVVIGGTFDFGEHYDLFMSALAKQDIAPGSDKAVAIAQQLTDEQSFVGYLQKHTPLAVVPVKGTGFSYGMTIPTDEKSHERMTELAKQNPAGVYLALKEMGVKHITEQVLGDLEKRLNE